MHVAVKLRWLVGVLGVHSRSSEHVTLDTLSPVPLITYMYFLFTQLNQLLDLDAKFGFLNGDSAADELEWHLWPLFYPHS